MEPSANVAGIARWTATFASCAGALVWVVGLSLIAITGVLPSDASYFLMGTVGFALGTLLVPNALVASSNLFVRGTGLIISVAMAVTGVALMLAATGNLSVRAPAWITTASELPFVALFVWMLFTSFLERERSQLGPVVLWIAVFNSAFLLVVVGISLRPYTHTNETGLIDSLLALFTMASLPSWLIAVVIRLWRPRLPPPTAAD